MIKNKNNILNIYVIGGDTNYANWMGGKITEEMENADLVVGTGGEDWHPSWYSDINNAHPTVSSNYERDVFERSKFNLAIKLGKKIVGICRSAQGGCVLAGGKLIQHQQNPGFMHGMVTYDGRKILTSSTHHQAQWPFNLDPDTYSILAWTQNLLKYKYLDKNTSAPPNKEVEICYYKNINFLAIQGHPEMIYFDRDENIQESISWHQNLLELFVNDKLT